jgi:hypothetical protein
MGIARGPNLIKDNLVFGYDTGYGVADVFTTTRFYKGKPVDNMATDPTFLNSTAGTFTSQAWGGDTGNGEFATNTSPEGGGLMYINHNTSTAAGGGGNYNDLDVNNWTLTNGVTYTRSWWAKSNITQTINGHMLSINGGGNNTYILGDSTDLVAGEWQRVSHTFTYSGTSNLDWRFRSINYNQSKVYIANIQLEVGSIASPFTATSRSDTASLIDLKRTTDIDVSNVSFDSTGQPDFDGTGDFIKASSTHSITSDITLEAVFNEDTSSAPHTTAICTDTGHQYGVKLMSYKNSNRYGLWLGFGSSSYVAMHAGTLDNNTIYHLVGSWQQTTGVVKIYLNGVLKSTLSTGQTSAISLNEAKVVIGADYHSLSYGLNGKVYVGKVYDKVLTAGEVKTNYNNYKGRFNI